MKYALIYSVAVLAVAAAARPVMSHALPADEGKSFTLTTASGVFHAWQIDSYLRTTKMPLTSSRYHYRVLGRPVKATFVSVDQSLSQEFTAPAIDVDTKMVDDPKTGAKVTFIEKADLTGGVNGAQTKKGVTITMAGQSIHMTNQSHVELVNNVSLAQKDPKAGTFTVTGSKGILDAFGEGWKGSMEGPVHMVLANRPVGKPTSDFDATCDRVTFQMGADKGQAVMTGNVVTTGTGTEGQLTGTSDVVTVKFTKVDGAYVITEIESGAGTSTLEQQP